MTTTKAPPSSPVTAALYEIRRYIAEGRNSDDRIHRDLCFDRINKIVTDTLEFEEPAFEALISIYMHIRGFNAPKLSIDDMAEYVTKAYDEIEEERDDLEDQVDDYDDRDCEIYDRVIRDIFHEIGLPNDLQAWSLAFTNEVKAALQAAGIRS